MASVGTSHVTIKDTDHGYRRVMEGLVRAARSALSLNVGILTDDEDIQRVAAAHEFGSGNLPRRSIVADWFDPKLVELRNDLRTAATRIVKGEEPQAVLGDLGGRYVASMRQRLLSGITPALSPGYLKEKLAAGGPPEPLVSKERRLLNSIVYAVGDEQPGLA